MCLDEYGWKDFMLQLVEKLNEFLSTRHHNITLEYNSSYILAYTSNEGSLKISWFVLKQIITFFTFERRS